MSPAFDVAQAAGREAPAVAQERQQARTAPAAARRSVTARERGRTRFVPHRDSQAHRRAHGPKPAADGAARHHGVRGRSIGGDGASRRASQRRFEQRGAPLTFTAYFLAAVVDAIKAVPEANSRWTDTALEIYDDIHIGVATAVEGVGLVVPVVRNVQSLDLFGIASRLDQLVTAAREGRLEPADVRGGTFTISNHGVSGSLLATPIVINQPQSAILGIGKVEKRPVMIEAGDEEKVVHPPEVLRHADDRPPGDGRPPGQPLPADVRQDAGVVASGTPERCARAGTPP